MADETIPADAIWAAGEALEEDFRYRQDALDGGRDALRAGVPILLRALADELVSQAATFGEPSQDTPGAGFALALLDTAQDYRTRADAIESEAR
jgi:hypothetical protein